MPCETHKEGTTDIHYGKFYLTPEHQVAETGKLTDTFSASPLYNSLSLFPFVTDGETH